MHCVIYGSTRNKIDCFLKKQPIPSSFRKVTFLIISSEHAYMNFQWEWDEGGGGGSLLLFHFGKWLPDLKDGEFTLTVRSGFLNE